MARCRALRAALAAAWLVCTAGAASAAIAGLCEQPERLDAVSQDRVLRFAAVVRSELERTDRRLALIARSGLDLRRFGVRYTHAGASLRHGPRAPWSVRQLYYACDEQRPRIFDQGLAGFAFGIDEAETSFISVLLLPPAAEADLERTLLDDRLALQMLGARYSPNAYPFSEQFQNCNQWLAEMLAAAWGPPTAGPAPRRLAQQWLQASGYVPARFDLDFPPPRWIGLLHPLLQHQDHPDSDLDEMRLRVSLPSSIEAFVQARHPLTQRIEFCRAGERIVVRHQGPPLSDDCRPRAGDRVVRLD